ncbi:patatin-like phospholipase family protein [Rubrobacter indicoceani]|uniref:patatin-like phospholipase family protein n=1 Tax=Rubrobacter indicoceani TaxID=2051957 RepID=UPI000E5A1BAA|nr:patatin-like phospholipase family protein [Rubrobacter indicoceani]
MVADGRRVAVACQGGGSHTAFTAGVLRRLLAEDDVEIVGLSGASGGAVCALLVHYGLLTGGRGVAGELLRGFWEANSVGGGPGAFFNFAAVQAQRVEATVGVTPAMDPYLVPERAREGLSRLLGSQVDFGRLAGLAGGSPRLFVGAVEVLSGEERAFDSDAGEITLEAVLASCAVPSLFRAVRVGEGLYWDGLFSQNPPLRGLPETGCDEIWVVQIDPKSREAEPRNSAEILDRRNQLAANLSLEQEVNSIETINRLVDRGSLVGERYRRIPVRRIPLERNLDSASKTDRDRDFILGLFDEGERAAEAFLGRLEAAGPGAPSGPERPPEKRRASPGFGGWVAAFVETLLQKATSVFGGSRSGDAG